MDKVMQDIVDRAAIGAVADHIAAACPDVLLVPKSKAMREYPGDPLPDRVQHADDIDASFDGVASEVAAAHFVPEHIRRSMLKDLRAMKQLIRSYA